MNSRYSEIVLLADVPLDPRYEHTCIWADEPTQIQQMSTREFWRGTEYTYLRKEKAIKVPWNCEELEERGVNYCYIKNSEITRYYFITNLEYLSENVTALHVELDVIQTYQFKWTLPTCFIERSHTKEDYIGQYLMDEGLELGEYVNNLDINTQNLDSLAIVIQSSVDISDDSFGATIAGYMMGEVYSGFGLFAVDASDLGALKLFDVIKKLSNQGIADAIQAMWMCPKGLLNIAWTNETEEMGGIYAVPPQKPNHFEMVMGVDRVALNGYTPRNNKLYSYPYSFVYAYNNMGEGAVYRYEEFTDHTPKFNITGNYDINPVMRLIPQNYRGYVQDNESALSLSGYPTCAWTQDAYKIWLAQNSNSQALAIQSGNIAVAAGAAQAALGVGVGLMNALPLVDTDMDGGSMISQGISMAYSGYQQVAGVMAARADKQIQPPQAKGVQSPGANFALGLHTFTISNRSIKKEYAEIIDNYFDLYGYKLNIVDVPQLKCRPYWNYIKTVGMCIKGNIPPADKAKINAIFDRGMTCWHAFGNVYGYHNAAKNVSKHK